jgi:hypothetical protein
MSSICSPGSDSRRQHRSGLPPSVSTCTVSWLPASSTPAALISCSLACGIASKMSPLAPAVPAAICSKGRFVIPGSRWALPEREVSPMLVQATSTGRHHLDAGEHRHWRGNGHAVAEDAGFEPDALWTSPLSSTRSSVWPAPEDLTNREIGDRPFLSPRTVSSHLYRSYPKLGVASCLQLRRGRSRDHVNTGSRRPRKRDARRFPQGNKHASPLRRAGYLDCCGAELTAPRLPAAG